MEKQSKQHELVSPGVYVLVWLALLVLTGLTVAVSGLNLKGMAIVMAIFIAGLKSSLVLNYFMHIRYESALFRNMVLVVIATIVIIVGLTFTDISFR